MKLFGTVINSAGGSKRFLAQKTRYDLFGIQKRKTQKNHKFNSIDEVKILYGRRLVSPAYRGALHEDTCKNN